jgi:aldose 1-epimerase
VNELRIADGPLEVVVLPEIGARLHRLRAFGHDLLRTPGDPATHASDPFFWGAYVMAPWCNRIEAGPVAVGSRQVALGSNVPDGSAIHGQVYARPWEVLGDRRLRIRAGGDGWPWVYEVGLRIELVDRLVRIELALTNRDSEPMPAGLGIHPWFRRPLLVAIRGDAVNPSNTAPAARAQPVDGPFDLRRMGEMPADLDATWSALAEPPVELRWPHEQVRAVMRVAAPTTYVVAASPGHLDAVAVEAQTHAPQALRRMLVGGPGGLALLEPGGTLGLVLELAFDRLDPAAGSRA